MQYCGLCCFAKDEDWYIEEWVNYHLLLGFDKIILYDNHSKIPLKSLFKEEIDQNRVIVHETNGDYIGTKAQGMSYTHCFKNYCNDFMWIGVIDADEIILLKQHNNIKEFLAEFENYGGVLLNWVYYGNPNLEKRGTKSQIHNFIYTIPNSTVTIGKSIVRPNCVEEFKGPHGPRYKKPFFPVNTEHLPLDYQTYSGPICLDSAQINHYYFRTKEDFLLKKSKWLDAGLEIKYIYDEAIKNYTVLDETASKNYNYLINNKRKELDINFNTTEELVSFFTHIINSPKLSNEIKILLSNNAYKFNDDGIIWLLRSMVERKNNQFQKALFFIKQALKSSGNSLIYHELAEIYRALGDMEHYKYADIQFKYKKNVEETSCI